MTTLVEVNTDCESETKSNISSSLPEPLTETRFHSPIQSLPSLPYDEEWTVAHISRDETSGDLRTSLSSRTPAGVRCQWHHTLVDCLELEKTEQLTATAFEAVPRSSLPITLPSPATMIAKIARFE